MARKLVGLLLLLSALNITAAEARQGNQTGSLGGTVRDAQNLVVPGAAVQVVSPAQQGERIATTDGLGAYLLPGLRPGRYTLTVELSGFQTVTSSVEVPLGGLATLEVTLRPATATEAVTVVAKPSKLSSAKGARSSSCTSAPLNS